MQSHHSSIRENCDFLRRLPEQHPYLELPDHLVQRTEDLVKDVKARLDSKTLSLALVGGFSAGKSTLINAFLGQSVLTTRVTPTTVCPTRILYGEEPVLEVKPYSLRPQKINSDFPTSIILSVDGEREVTMDPIDEVTYRAHIDVSPKTWVRLGVEIPGGEALAETCFIPHDLTRLSVYYNLLHHKLSVGPSYHFIPNDQLPTIRLGYSDSSKTYTLRSDGRENRWYACIDQPEKAINLYLAFDWAWYKKEYPARLVPTGPGPLRPLYQAARWIGRVLRLKGLARWADERSSRSFARWVPTPERPKSGVLPLNPGKGGKIAVVLDLEAGTFTATPDHSPTSVRRLRLPKSQANPAGNLISALTAARRANEAQRDYSGTLAAVTLEYPATVLKHSVEIIDTPGISAEAEHTQITLEIIEKQADACLFLSPADQPGTLTDLEFIHKNLAHMTGDMIFVITKADKAGDDKEALQEIIDVLREKIQTHVRISDPRIYTVSPKDALTLPNSPAGLEFQRFTQDLVDFMARNQSQIIARRLIHLQKALMDQVSQRAQEKERDYQKKLEELKAIRIENLTSFLNRQQSIMLNKLRETTDLQNLYDRAERNMMKTKREMLQHVVNTLTSATTKSELKNLCEQKLSSVLIGIQATMGHEYNKSTTMIQDHLTKVYKKAFLTFEEDFERQYPFRRLTGRSVEGHSVQLGSFLNSSAQREIAVVSEAIGKTQFNQGMSAAGGAVVGSMLLPGIGTILGGLAGWFFGTIFGPSLEELRSQVVDQIDDHLNEALDKRILPALSDTVNKSYEAVEMSLTKAIGDYAREYNAQVDKLIRAHERQKAEVDRYLKGAGHVLSELKTRCQTMDQLLKDLSRQTRSSGRLTNLK